MDIISIIGILSTSGSCKTYDICTEYSNFYKAAKILNLLAVTSSVEAGYETIDRILTEARGRLNLTENKKERQQLKTLIMTASSLKPLSANGYFNISFETLTGMLSVR